jgi:predicted transcriptional regulator
MNSDTIETVRHYVLGAAKGLEVLGNLAGPTTAGIAAQAAGALIAGIAGLLKSRTPEEVRKLLEDLEENPAERVDLGGLDAEIADVIRKRREADDTRETP